MYHTQVTWPYQSSAVQPQLLPERSGSNPVVPRMDIYETRDEIVYIFEMPGINAEYLEVEIEGRNIAISAPILNIDPRECSYRYQERPKGRIMRIVSAVLDADVDKVRAETRNGLLEMRFMKMSETLAAGRKIPVQAVQ